MTVARFCPQCFDVGQENIRRGHGTFWAVMRWYVRTSLDKRTNPMRKSPLIALLIATFALSACETIQGAGQDISAAGDAITSESQEVQSDL